MAFNYHPEPQPLSLFASVKNIADEDYIVDRTRGIRTGMPRQLQVGATYRFW